MEGGGNGNLRDRLSDGGKLKTRVFLEAQGAVILDIRRHETSGLEGVD